MAGTTACRRRTTSRPRRPTSPPGSGGLFPPRRRAERRAADRLAEERGKGRGRVERRRLRATARLNEYRGRPDVAQVCVVERTRRVNGAETTESVFDITGLPPSEAGPARLVRVVREHWRVENPLHHVRDVSAGEDACRVRTGGAPEVPAGLRNAALTVLRASGQGNIAAAFRHLAAATRKAVELATRFVAGYVERPCAIGTLWQAPTDLKLSWGKATAAKLTG